MSLFGKSGLPKKKSKSLTSKLKEKLWEPEKNWMCLNVLFASKKMNNLTLLSLLNRAQVKIFGKSFNSISEAISIAKDGLTLKRV